jgi:hypothetical protein
MKKEIINMPTLTPTEKHLRRVARRSAIRHDKPNCTAPRCVIRKDSVHGPFDMSRYEQGRDIQMAKRKQASLLSMPQIAWAWLTNWKRKDAKPTT